MKNLIIATAVVISALFVINGIVITVAKTPAGPRTDTYQPEVEVDQVVASFERELNHQPGPAARPSGRAIEEDILYKAANEMHWTPDARSEAATEETKIAEIIE